MIAATHADAAPTTVPEDDVVESASEPAPIDVAAIPLQIEAEASPTVETNVEVGARLEDERPEPVAPSQTRVEPTSDVAATAASVPVERPRNLPDIPPVTLALPPDSALELVETRRFSAEATPEPEAPRPRRVRPQRVVIAEEPLQMVETRPDGSDKPPA
jgi:hypothetical protein